MRSSVWLALLVACGGGTPLAPDATIDAPDTTIDAPEATIDAQTLFACGQNTHEQSSTCIADPRVELRAPLTIRADGYSPVTIRALAFDGDGLPVHDRVVVTLDRASAGTVASPTFALGDLGGATTIVPCNAADSSNTTCAGTAHLSLALADAPQAPLAGVDVELIAPSAVPSVTPCLGGGNVLHFDADNYSSISTLTITSNGVFDVTGWPDQVSVHVVANNVGWALWLGVRKLGIPLLPSVYEHAKAVGYGTPGDPLYELGDRGCTPVARFQIHSYVYDAVQNKVTSLTASFEERCDFDATRRRTGCVHFSQ